MDVKTLGLRVAERNPSNAQGDHATTIGRPMVAFSGGGCGEAVKLSSRLRRRSRHVGDFDIF